MTNSLATTIYIALISGVVLAVLMILLQVAIFVLIQNINEFKSFLNKTEKKLLEGLNIFLNPFSAIKGKNLKRN